jgi:hypothetical protein
MLVNEHNNALYNVSHNEHVYENAAAPIRVQIDIDIHDQTQKHAQSPMLIEV